MALSVLIVGAGPTGLLLALALLKNGIQVRIVDRDLNRSPGQRGAGIMPRTQEIFRYLGVLDDVRSMALDIKPMCEYKMPGGVEVLKIMDMAPKDEPTPSKPYPNPVLLGQYNTEAILRKHIEGFGVTVEYGTELVSLKQYPDHVDAVLVNKAGGTDKSETVACHWLVGSDGAKGVVRKEIGLTFLGNTYEDTHWILGLVELQGLGTEFWYQWGDVQHRGLIVMPTERPGYFSFIVTGENADSEALVADEDALRQTLQDHAERQDLTFGRFEAVSSWRPNIRMVNKFDEGRVFVAGDAAHVHTPAGGQGLNSGAQDVFNLAWKLTLAEKGVARPSLLETYTEERLPVITEMLRRSTRLFDQMRRSEREGFLRGGVLLQLGVNCRWSSIVVDERTLKPQSASDGDPYGAGADGTLRAGDRAPQAPGLVTGAGVGETSLFDLFGPDHHTVLLFNVPAEEAKRVIGAVKKYPIGLVKTVAIGPQGTSAPQAAGAPDVAVVDKAGHAFSAYQVSLEKPTIVIVRPDGAVSGIVYGLEGLKKYFGGVFSTFDDAA